jgi:hypothetical protein
MRNPRRLLGVVSFLSRQILGRHPKGDHRRVSQTLVLGDDVLGPSVLHGLIDDWLVPAITESLMRDQAFTFERSEGN